MSFCTERNDLAVCEKRTEPCPMARLCIGFGRHMKQLIYIAEDEKKTLEKPLRKFLENDGYEVCAFETGDALLGALFKRRADLVILDIMMPGTDGLTCCRLIREKG